MTKCTHCDATVLSAAGRNEMTDQFHPGKCLPDCMMPDGGECCPGYIALYDAYWHLVRAPAALAATPGGEVREEMRESGTADAFEEADFAIIYREIHESGTTTLQEISNVPHAFCQEIARLLAQSDQETT